MASHDQYKKQSAWYHQRVYITSIRAGLFEYYHVPTMKKLFSIE